jgi:hypothetical protein
MTVAQVRAVDAKFIDGSRIIPFRQTGQSGPAQWRRMIAQAKQEQSVEGNR